MCHFLQIYQSQSFRPLTGTLLSKPKAGRDFVTCGLIVSVPSRGLSYLNRLTLWKKALKICFRPLTGTLLSKHKFLERVFHGGYSFRPLTGTLLSKHFME